MELSREAMRSPSEDFSVVSASTARVGTAVTMTAADTGATATPAKTQETPAGSGTSAAPTKVNVATLRRASDGEDTVATGGNDLTALRAAVHPAPQSAREGTARRLTTAATMGQQTYRVAATRRSSTFADVRSVDSYWTNGNDSLSITFDKQVEGTTFVNCRSRCSDRQLPAVSYLPGSSSLFQPATAVAEGSCASYLPSVRETQEKSKYSDAPASDRSFYSRRSSWSSKEGTDCITGSSSTSLLRETLAKPLQEVWMLEGSKSDRQSTAETSSCGRAYGGHCEVAWPPARYCSSPNGCNRGDVVTRCSQPGQEPKIPRRLWVNGATVDEVFTSLPAVANAGLQRMSQFNLEQRDTVHKISCLEGNNTLQTEEKAWREPPQRQEAHQPKQQHQVELIMEKDRVGCGWARRPLQAQECWHQQLQAEPQQLQQRRETGEQQQTGALLLPQQQWSWRQVDTSRADSTSEEGRHIRSSRWQQAAVAVPRVELNCCCQIGELHVATCVQQEHTGLYSCAEKQPGGEDTRLLPAVNCCNRKSDAGTLTPKHTPCVLQFPQPVAAQTAAHCCSEGLDENRSLLPSKLVRAAQFVPTTVVPPALHRAQPLGRGALQRVDTHFLRATSRPLHTAVLQNPAPAADTHCEVASSPAGPASAAAVSLPGGRSCSAESSACLCGSVWQKTYNANEDAGTMNRCASADVANRSSKEQMRLATAAPDCAAVVTSLPPVSRGLCGPTGADPAPGSSSAAPVDSSLGRREQGQRRSYPQLVSHEVLRQQQLSQPLFQQEVHEHLEKHKEVQPQLQQQQRDQQLQPKGRQLDAVRGWVLHDREIVHRRKQAPAVDCELSAVSLDSADGTPDDDLGRRWLGAAPGWEVPEGAKTGTGTVDAVEVRGRQEVVAPRSFACTIEDSVTLAPSPASSTPLSTSLTEGEAQRADGEDIGTVFPRQNVMFRLQSHQTLLQKFSTQVESSRHHQQRELLESKQRPELVGRQRQELQQQGSWELYSYVEESVNSSDNKSESAPAETSTICSSDAHVVEVGEEGESWRPAAVGSASSAVGKYSAASSASYAFVPTSHSGQRPADLEEGTLCTGSPSSADNGQCRKATSGGTRWSCSISPPTHLRSTASEATAGSPSKRVEAAVWCRQTGRPLAFACSCSLVQPPATSACVALCVPCGLLPTPVQFLHTVGVVGAGPPAVTETADAREGDAARGGKEMAATGQGVSPRRVGRSHSVLKRAASADPASARFAKVKTVSFADLNECDSSVVGRSTSSLQGTAPTIEASASVPLCPSSSTGETVAARRIGKSSAGAGLRRPAAGEEKTARRGAGGDSAERAGADVGIEMPTVGAGGRQEADAAGTRRGRTREEDDGEEARKAEIPLAGRLRRSLAAALALLRRTGSGDDAVVAAADRGGGERQDVSGRAEASARKDFQTRSSGSLSSEGGSVRRTDEITSGGRDRREARSGGSSRSSGEGAEESGGDGSEGEGRDGGRRRRRRASHRRRRRRFSGGHRSRSGRRRGSTGPGSRAERSSRRSQSAESTPSSDSVVAKASSRLTQLFRNIFRAFQNLTEHDTVFRMRDELFRHDSAPLSRGGAPGSDVTVGASSVGSAAAGGRSSPGGGRGGATAGGVLPGLSGIESPGGGGGGGAGGREGSVSRSVSSDVLLRRLPLKFVDRDLEDLFAGNINQWMTTRLLLMGVLMLVVTSLMWPLMAWSFNLQDAFGHSEPIGVLFHVDMSLNVVVSLLFVVTRFSDILTDHAELIGDAGTFVVVTIWGVWNTVASFILESSYVRDVIHPQIVGGQQGYVSLEKTTSWSSAQEASSAVAYMYGLLLIVQLDVVYPSRTRRTWQIHVMFFLLSSSSIIVRGAINPNFVPVPFVVIRVATYLMLTIFLYIGRHATELQQRQTFYNWLMTRKRMDRLESDLKRHKEGGKVSTAVEQLVDLIKQCKDIFQSLETGVADISAFHRMQLDECNRTLDRCLSILTNTTNLYTVQFGELDSDTHREIIQAFLHTHNTTPADWTRMAREALSRTPDSVPGAGTPSRSTFRPPPGISDAIGRDITVDVRPPPDAPTGTAEQRLSSNSHDISEAPQSSLSSKGSAFDGQTESAFLSSASTAGVGVTAAAVAGAQAAVPCPAPAAVAAPISGSTTEGSKLAKREQEGDAVFKFVYSSPRGVDFSDDEVVVLQLPRKRTRVFEDRGALAFNAFEGASESADSRLWTKAAADESEAGVHKSRPGTTARIPPGKSAATVRDVGRRSRWSSSPRTAPVSDEAAGEGAATTVAPGYGSPVSSGSSMLEDASFKHTQGKLSPDSHPADFAERQGGAMTIATGGTDPSSATSSLAGRREGRVAPAEREGQRAVTRRGDEAATVNRAQGRRLSSAVAPEESEDVSVGATSDARSAQQKDLLTPEGVVPHAAIERSRSSATAAVASGRRSVVGGDIVYRAFVMDQRARRDMRARNEAVANILTLPSGSPELNMVQRLSEEEVQSWDFDCLMYAKESPAPLVEVGYALLARPCENLMLPNKEILVRFLKAVEAQYDAVPYHNSIHGFMVSQKMVALTHLLKLNNKVNSRDLAVMVVAGLCHDIGHPGRNNALLINAIDPVAVLYNDKSVLENYHSCLTFKTLDLPDCDVFWPLRSKVRREYHVIRSLIIELILATDMKNHFETVSRFRIRRLAADFDISGEEDLWFLLKIVIKCADLSHCGVRWSEHFEWCLRLCTEFYDQGDEELARHLPVSPLCEREKHAEIAKAQLGFMNFVTIPLYEELVAVDSTGNVERCCISYMKTNVKHWELTASAGVPVPLYGKGVAPEVQPPFSQLLDQSQHPKPKAGSKAAEIASRYARVTLTCVDLTPLVMRTQLSRSQRDSHRSTDRSKDTQNRRTAT